MKIDAEFSKYANHYGSYNIIQKKVAKKLLSHLATEPKKILDLGCGSGMLASLIKWEYERFVGVDFAKGMLDLHPKGENISCIYGDFNDAALYERLAKEEFEYILSASALQWAEDLEFIFQKISLMQTKISLALFSSKTFATLHKTANLKPILPSKEQIATANQNHLGANMEVVEYRLEFENTREMFRYIKKSGVSGNRNALSYKETKKLMQEYPVNYLEFEVVFLYR